MRKRLVQKLAFNLTPCFWPRRFTLCFPHPLPAYNEKKPRQMNDRAGCKSLTFMKKDYFTMSLLTLLKWFEVIFTK